MENSIRLHTNKNNYYSVRFRIHKSLISYFNKQAINKSLNTKEFNQAKIKADVIYLKYKQILKVSSMLSKEQIQELVDNYIVEQLEQDLVSRSEDGIGIVYASADNLMFNDGASASRNVISNFIGDYRQDLANSDISSIEETGKELLSNVGIEYDASDTSHRLFMLQLLQGQIALLNEVSDRYKGLYKAQNVSKKDITTSIPALAMVTVKDAYDRFNKWYSKTGITPKQYEATTNKLMKTILPFFNENTNVATITLDDIDEFKEFLEAFPNISRLPYKHMSFDAISKCTNIPEDVIISTDTQSKYLKILKQFFNFMVDDNIIQHNPCKRLIMPDDKSVKRDPFNKEDLKQLFTLFETLDDRKYIYYTLAYTGMRPSEFWKSSISEEEGIIYFDLTDPELALKTSHSRRKIPLHKRLLEMGMHQKLLHLQRTFKQEAISIYFNKKIKPSMSGSESKIMYSFRHTVATELKRSDVIMDKVSELLGHSYESNTMTKSTYAGGYTLHQLKEAIDKLPY